MPDVIASPRRMPRSGMSPVSISSMVNDLSDVEALTLLHDWSLWARPDQVRPEGDWWDIWLILTGRGWGKTRTAAELVRHWVNTDGKRRIHFVGRTAGDVRDTMVEGESGIINVCSADIGNVPKYLGSKRQIRWPNGAKALLFTAETPDQLRGPECDCYWADEAASWKYAQDTWDNLQFGARMGEHVPGVVTTTPRPIGIIRHLLKAVGDNVTLTKGTTYDNADNLAPSFIRTIKARYEGTRLGRQEIFGDVLDDNPFALWHRVGLDEHRVSICPELARVVVAVDPAVTANEDSDETGIIVCGVGKTAPGDHLPHFYVLEDFSIQGASPAQWAREVERAFERFEANVVVVEVNQGGDMVASTIRSVNHRLPIKEVRATRGKVIRADPISAIYEQGRAHHVGTFAHLEDQLCEWQPGNDSPDRLDALVWGLTYLSTSEETPGMFSRHLIGA